MMVLVISEDVKAPMPRVMPALLAVVLLNRKGV
jgi:hypothetical protein